MSTHVKLNHKQESERERAKKNSQKFDIEAGAFPDILH